MPVVTALKSVKQQFQPTPELSQLMGTFRQMVNDCIRIGLDNNVPTMKKLCNLAYKQLAIYDIMSYYKLCAISHAAGILTNRKKSLRRGRVPRSACQKVIPDQLLRLQDCGWNVESTSLP